MAVDVKFKIKLFMKFQGGFYFLHLRMNKCFKAK